MDARFHRKIFQKNPNFIPIRFQHKSFFDEQMKIKPQPTVALLPWGDLIEDFLDSIGVSFEAFCREMNGGWMFGYIDALKSAGVHTVLICTSKRVARLSYHTHLPTGATICVLPVSKLYRAVRHYVPNPYGWTLREAVGDVHGGAREVFLRALRDAVSYLATPLFPLARELRRQGCQAILCQEYEYPRFDVCVALASLLRLPVFATFQGGDFQLSRLEPSTRPRALRASAGLIIAAQTEIERVQSHYKTPPPKLAQIFNPLNVAGWSAFDRSASRAAIGIPLDAEVVVSHGRIDIHRKGLDILLAAWEQLCGERPERDLRLLLVGTGSDAEKFHRMIGEKQLRGVVWIDQYVREQTIIQRYLSAADVYTLASRHEGFPVAPIEAMSCGLPVVATDAPGVADIFERGEAFGGIVVKREDPPALASALGRVLDNPAWGRELGRNARLRAETAFSHEAIGQQLRNFLLA
jgi:glycosyltransferase involved in cell wall biosynthesis